MRIVFSLVLLFCQFILSSQQSGFIFIENKGQWHHDVLFKTDLKNGHLYATKMDLYMIFMMKKNCLIFMKTTKQSPFIKE